MTSVFAIGLAVSVVYFIFKFVEARFVLKEEGSARPILRDTLIVYLSSVVGLFVMEQFGEQVTKKAPTNAFVGKPDF